MVKTNIILRYLFTGVTSFIVCGSNVSVFGESLGKGDLKGRVFYILREEEREENQPLVFYYDLETGTEREVGRLPLPLRSHTGLSISSDGEKIVGCAVIPFDKDEGPKVEVYALGRLVSGEYELTEKQSYSVPVFPFRSVYDEWDNAVYLTCNEALPLEEKDGNRFGLQDFKLKVTLAVIDLDENALTSVDITSRGDQTGVSGVTERGIYLAGPEGMKFIRRGQLSLFKEAGFVSRYVSVNFPLILYGGESFVIEGIKGPEDAFLLDYVPFTQFPRVGLGEAEFAIPKREKGYTPFYQLTNTVSPYSGHCLITKHYKDFEREDASLCWELLALDTTTWEITSIVKKYGGDYAIHNPPFVFGWIAPEEGTGGDTAHNYIHNNNFIYRPWSLGED